MRTSLSIGFRPGTVPDRYRRPPYIHRRSHRKTLATLGNIPYGSVVAPGSLDEGRKQGSCQHQPRAPMKPWTFDATDFKEATYERSHGPRNADGGDSLA